MGILTSFLDNPSTFSRGGVTPSIPDFATSGLHNTYSLNGQPQLTVSQAPSSLDLNGVTPTQYIHNLPN